jgi:hypothetical protein
LAREGGAGRERAKASERRRSRGGGALSLPLTKSSLAPPLLVAIWTGGMGRAFREEARQETVNIQASPWCRRRRPRRRRGLAGSPRQARRGLPGGSSHAPNHGPRPSYARVRRSKAVLVAVVGQFLRGGARGGGVRADPRTRERLPAPPQAIQALPRSRPTLPSLCFLLRHAKNSRTPPPKRTSSEPHTHTPPAAVRRVCRRARRHTISLQERERRGGALSPTLLGRRRARAQRGGELREVSPVGVAGRA